MSNYPVLPLWQPWASLCVNINPKTGRAWKQIETRPNACPKTLFGKTVLIHACATETEFKKVRFTEPFQTAIDYRLLPFGAIIGSVNIVASMEINASSFYIDEDIFPQIIVNSGLRLELHVTTMEYEFGNYELGRYAWDLRNAKLLERPIPFKANQGINYIELGTLKYK